MQDSFSGVFILFAAVLMVSLLTTLIGHYFGPRRSARRKTGAYASSLETLGPDQRRIPHKFYRLAALFVVLDVAIVLLYPWAVSFLETDERAFLFAAMLIFVLILSAGYAYAWKMGALEWD
jgi:NADH-quinone oxidoreductase subunit A